LKEWLGQKGKLCVFYENQQPQINFSVKGSVGPGRINALFLEFLIELKGL
jgi:hypothetical protein